MSERLDRIRSVAKDAANRIEIKKAELHKFGMANLCNVATYKSEANKSDLPQDTDSEIYRTIVANTYLYMDSHDDVHMKNVFKKTITETKKIFLLHDHKFETDAQIGTILKSYEKEVAWKEVGLDIEGKTMALLHDVKIEKSKNPKLFEMYKNGEIDQHSVGMQYVNIKFAADDPEDKEAYSLYTSILPMLGNKEKVQEQGYFFPVFEAKLRETSAVLLGSNDLTGIYNENKSVETFDEIEKKLDEIFKNEDEKEKIYNICRKFVDTFEDLSRENHSPVEKKPSFIELISK